MSEFTREGRIRGRYESSKDLYDVKVHISMDGGSACGSVSFPEDWTLERCLKIIPELNPTLREELGNIDKLSIEVDRYSSVCGKDLGSDAAHFRKMDVDVVYGELIKWWLLDHPDDRVVSIGGPLV